MRSRGIVLNTLENAFMTKRLLFLIKFIFLSYFFHPPIDVLLPNGRSDGRGHRSKKSIFMEDRLPRLYLLSKFHRLGNTLTPVLTAGLSVKWFVSTKILVPRCGKGLVGPHTCSWRYRRVSGFKFCLLLPVEAR